VILNRLDTKQPEGIKIGGIYLKIRLTGRSVIMFGNVK